MVIRLVKVGLVGLIAVFLLLVGGDNLIDYETNFAFVQHVMSMDTVQRPSALLDRAVEAPGAHHAVYLSIIAIQLLAGVLCLLGALRLWAARARPAAVFNGTKALAAAGLALAFALWFFGFMVVGGEWFQMWRSASWNGQQAAFRFIGCVGLVLLVLLQGDEEHG